MSPHKCSSHPETPAVYRCDGCGELLCAKCIEEGHRLLFCRHCGERALPLQAAAPAAAPELRRVKRKTAPYTLPEALLYPFRGLGAYVFWGYVVVLGGFLVLGVIPGVGCMVLVFELLILLMLPGLLFAIVRTTADGDTELPDWPDWTDVGERLFEWLGALLALLISLLPLVAVLWLLGCGVDSLLTQGGWRCGFGLALGSVVGAAVWVPAFGAVATAWSPWVALRLDLHCRAVVTVGTDAWKTLGLLVSLLLVRQAAGAILQPVALLGAVLQIAVGTYTLFTGAHLIGLLFRRHSTELEEIYG